MARCDGRPLARFPLKTVTSFAQLRRLGDEGRHHAEEGLLRPTASTLRTGCATSPAEKRARAASIAWIEIGRRQEGAYVVFGEEAEALRHPLVVIQAGVPAQRTPVSRCR